MMNYLIAYEYISLITFGLTRHKYLKMVLVANYKHVTLVRNSHCSLFGSIEWSP